MYLCRYVFVSIAPLGAVKFISYQDIIKALIGTEYIKEGMGKGAVAAVKGNSLCKKRCLHDLRFMKTRSFSPNLSKLAELTSAISL